MKRHLATGMLFCFVISLSSAQDTSVFMGRGSSHGRFPMGQQSENLGFGDIGRITGNVVGAADRPLIDVVVQLRDISTGRVLASDHTSRTGAFSFEMVPYGRYEVAVANEIAGGERVEVGNSSSSVVTLQLNNSDLNRASAGNGLASVAEYKIPSRARNAYEKAEKAFLKGHVEDVSQHLQQALLIHPDYAAALTLRGVLSFQRNDLAAALNDFDKAIRADSNYVEAYSAMAAALNGLSRFDDALRAAEHASRLSPNCWQANYEMAKSYLGKADYRRALDQLAHTQQQLGKEYPPLYLLRAHIFIVLKNYEGAAGELKSFLKSAPHDPKISAVRDTLERIGALMASSHPMAAANAAPR